MSQLLDPPPCRAAFKFGKQLVEALLIVDGPAQSRRIAEGGDVLVGTGASQRRFALSALPDARLLTDGAGRLLVLGGRTLDYPHAALGDDVEATPEESSDDTPDHDA